MKRNLANSILVIGIIALLAACSGERRADVLPASKLEAVLYDYHLAQVLVNDLPSNQRYKKDLYFGYVYDKHGVTEAQVDSSLVYYARYPEGLAEIYVKLSERIEADLQRLEGEDRPLMVREAVAIAGDSVNLWYDAPFVEMNASPLKGNRYSFTIPTDTNFKPFDLIVWEGEALFLDERVDSLHKYLHLDLRVAYMNDSIVSADTLLYSSGKFSIGVTDSVMVRSINGTAYLKSANGDERVLLLAPSLMRYHSSGSLMEGDTVSIKQ